MRSLRWRAAITVMGVTLVLGYVWATGRAGYTVQIDYSWAGEFLNGAEVIIDGEVAGTLQPYSQRVFVSSFVVEAGTHTVQVVHEHCPGGRAYDFTLGVAEGRRKIYMADAEEESTCRVSLR